MQSASSPYPVLEKPENSASMPGSPITPAPWVRHLLVLAVGWIACCHGTQAAPLELEVQGSRSVTVGVPSQWVLSATGGAEGNYQYSTTEPEITPPARHPSYFQTNFSGMMKSEEPSEGPIPAAGRTYRGSFRLWNQENVTAIQFLFGNLSPETIHGAKMLVGISTNGNSSLLPTRDGVAVNEVTGNPRTGWVQVTIGSDPELPVRADPDGTGLAWTDPVSFGSDFSPDQGEVVWRIWLPARANAPYARTFCGGSESSADSFSVIRSLAMLQRDVLGTSDWMRFGYADGDQVSDPSNPASWITTPNPQNTFGAYGRNYVSSIPILGYRWTAKRQLPLIEFVGDSITQGYGDRNHIVSMDGVPGRLLRALGSGADATFSIVNFGQSGFTPEQYLARWKGLARADPEGATAMAYSIFSPNGFAAFDVQTWERVEEMKATCIAAEQAAEALGRRFIPVFITGTNMFFLNPCLDRDPRIKWCQDRTDKTKALLDWAKERYGSRLLDLHEAITDRDTIGPSMLGGLFNQDVYTDDHTHPNTDGYNVLGTSAISQLPALLDSSIPVVTTMIDELGESAPSFRSGIQGAKTEDLGGYSLSGDGTKAVPLTTSAPGTVTWQISDVSRVRCTVGIRSGQPASFTLESSSDGTNFLPLSPTATAGNTGEYWQVWTYDYPSVPAGTTHFRAILSSVGCSQFWDLTLGKIVFTR
jgi:lysophospholipase L1-like esterase